VIKIRISIKIPKGFEVKFSKLKPQEKENLRAKLQSKIAEELR